MVEHVYAPIVLKIHTFGNGDGVALLLPRYEKSYLWGVILLLLYWCVVKYRRLGSVSKYFMNYLITVLFCCCFVLIHIYNSPTIKG